jgi:hypothetical protein
MPFNGNTTNDFITANLAAEDISAIIATLMPKETPFMDFLGASGVRATATKHEYIQDFMLPNYIIASTAVNSATAATAFQVNGLGEALTVGTILENESVAPEIVQVTSIVGPNSIVVSRQYGGGAVGSLVAGGQFYVRGYAAIEGREHSGDNAQRLGSRTANTVGYFAIDVSASASQIAQAIYGNDSFTDALAKLPIDAMHSLEKEVLRGVLNGTNSLGTTSATRTMRGVRDHITTINSTVAANSFQTNPHLYIGNVWEETYQQGASTSESWAIVAGRTFFRNISDLNDTKVEDSNATELFKRVVRRYTGPFGSAEVFHSRALPATELLLVPRERIKVVPFRDWQIVPMAKTGDNEKAMLVGEYTVEVHHPNAMARLRV